MKVKQRKLARAAASPSEPQVPARGIWWAYPLAVLAAVVAVLIAYAPALHGPFLFDDSYLPFNGPLRTAPFLNWVVSIRPLLMASFWANVQFSGDDTYSYHVVNVLLHVMTTMMIFVVARRLLEWAGAELRERVVLAGWAAAIFLLHPLQTESVAYIASRSETLSVFLFMSAYAVFICRRDESIGLPRVAVVLLLFVCALGTKEHTVALAPLLVLTDLYWNRPAFSVKGVLRNWKLYAVLLAAGAYGMVRFFRMIVHDDSAGFAVRAFTWYQYLFTQFRAIFVYLQLFFVPVGQNLDPDFPISHTLGEHGAAFALTGLLLITGLAWAMRNRYRLASFGWMMFLLLLAPTSSFIPILDPIAERRMYLPMLGLLLVVVDCLRHWRPSGKVLRAGMAVVLLACMLLTHARAEVWSDGVLLWQDSVRNSPNKVRPHFQLAMAYYARSRCDLAAGEYAAAAKVAPPASDLLLDWALALDCLNQQDAALERLRQAAALQPGAHVYSQIGMIFAKQSRWQDALDALKQAEGYDPAFAPVFVYRGNIHIMTNEPAAAVADFEHALAVEPDNQQAREGLAIAQRKMAGPK